MIRTEVKYTNIYEFTLEIGDLDSIGHALSSDALF
jgi:hypothetical protein